jgi:hypothetical protein
MNDKIKGDNTKSIIKEYKEYLKTINIDTDFGMSFIEFLARNYPNEHIKVDWLS